MLDSMVTWYLRKTHFSTWDDAPEGWGFDEDIGHRIKVGWFKWSQVFGVLCDLSVLYNIKDKYYRIVIQPDMLYRVEYWPSKSLTCLTTWNVHATMYLWHHKKRSCIEQWHTREIVADTSRVESCATLFYLVWTYLIKTPIYNGVIRQTSIDMRREIEED
jgi:hypothetical protein